MVKIEEITGKRNFGRSNLVQVILLNNINRIFSSCYINLHIAIDLSTSCIIYTFLRF